MPSTKIRTELTPDAPVELPANYVMDGVDRRYLDDQIRGVMLHLAESVIRGLHGTYFELDASSAPVVAGDTVALAGTGVGALGLPKVTKSTAAVLTAAGIAGGIVVTAAQPGGAVRVANGGVLPPSITGLATGDAGPVRVNTTTSRCQKVVSLGASDYPLGFVDASGFLTVSIFSAVAASGSSTDGAAIHTNVAAEIAGIAAKATPVGTDLIVIEDSAAGNAKKSVELQNLPFASSGVAGLIQYSNGAGGFSSEAGFAYDAAANRMSVGNQVWSGADSETLVADTHNLAPTNIATIARLTLLNQTGSAVNLTGLTGGAVGRLMLLEVDPTSDANVVLPIEHTGSITTNRWRGSDDVTLTPGAAVLIYYHSATRWLIVGGTGGASVSSAITDDSTYGGGTQSVAVSIDGLKTEIDGKSATGHNHDHNSLANLTAGDPHTQYSPVDGSRAYTAPVSGVTPTADAHLATKAYVDALAQGLDVKPSVRAVATSNQGTLSGTAQTIDGFALNTVGMRVLLTAQSSAVNNGIWVVQSGAWTRPTDFDTGDGAAGAFTFVESGTTNADSGWVCTTNTGSDVIGTNTLAWTQFSGAGQITAGGGLTKTGNTLDVGGSASITVSADSLAVNPAGVDHGSLGGISDDDHAQYMLREPNGTVSDNRLMRVDGTTGRTWRQSAATEDDSGNVTGWTSVTSQRHRVTSKAEVFESGASAGERLWDETAVSDVLTRRTRNDADNDGRTHEEVEREGIEVRRIRRSTQYATAEVVDSFSVEVDTADSPAASSLLRDKAGNAVSLAEGFTYYFEVTVETNDGSADESGKYLVVANRRSGEDVAFSGSILSSGDATTSGLDMQFAEDTVNQRITCQPTVGGKAGDRKVRWSVRVERRPIVTVDT